MTTRIKKAYILIGLPGTGKSTWRNHFLKLHGHRPFTILSTDDIIERVAKKKHLKYSDVFRDEIDKATQDMNAMAEKAFKFGHSVIWDNTNMTRKGRAKKLAKIPEEYKKIAMVFREPNEFGELDRRLNIRAETEGKFIPEFVLERMRDSYDEPALSEGFDEIVENIPKFSGAGS